MRLRRSALSFLLLTGLSLGLLSPARAAEPSAPSAGGAGQIVGEPSSGDPTTVPAPGDTLSVSATREEAQDSLAEVKELFAPKADHEARSMITSGQGKDATLALRDLSLRLGALPRAERNAAYADFQRPWTYNPTDTGHVRRCAANVCVHWATSGPNASQTPYAESVLSTLVHVSQAYHAAGYRYPRGDLATTARVPTSQNYLGGTAQTDIYLTDVGDQGKYGYCTVDVDNTGHYVFGPSNSRSSDLPAFCVLDNDFAKSQFPTRHTSLQDLQVTAAHEYFHAVQFAYDYLEDRWFMEATATWAEDELYSSIDDNRQYLPRSQLRYPGVSLDTFNGAGGFLQYGDWLFFRYLTERLPSDPGGLPVLMRRMWQYADSVSGPDYYSIQAVAAALREKHVDFNRMFAQYAAANQHPATAYSEGRAYPSGKVRKTFRLKPGKRSTSATYRVNHLAYATTRFVPKSLPSKRTKLTLSVDMANRKSGSVAVALVFAKNGRVTTRFVKLGKAGNGKIRVPFSSRRVSRVELVLVNANHAYKRCWVRTPYSCSGIPARNNVKEKLRARVS